MSNDLDTVRFPRAAGYLALQPHGLASHPECKVKGSLALEIVTDLTPSVIDGLPDVLRPIVETPPPESSWVDEVHVNVLLLVLADELARRSGDSDALIAHAFDATRRLLSGPLYKALFFVVSPVRMLTSVDVRWSALRRGTRIEIAESDEKMARMVMHYPDRLYDEFILAVRAASLRAMVVCAGGSKPSSTLGAFDRRSAEFVLRWELGGEL